MDSTELTSNHREITMRLILIDSNSGFIFGEFRSSDYTGNFDIDACLTEAANHVDAEFGEHGRAYAVLRSDPRTTQGGYRVYRADVRGSDQVPEIVDGQDQEMIDAVERDCEYMGFVAF